MALSSPIDVGYRPGALRAAWLRARLKSLFISLVAFAALGYGAFKLAEYISNFPRERSHAELSFLERFRLGSERVFQGLFAVLTVPELGKDQSRLPLAEIYIDGENIDKLNSDLPQSGRVYQKAMVRLSEEAENESKVFKAKVRYRGDSINHWAMPHKSWRIHLTKDKLFQGRSTFNLYLPRTPSQVADYIGYEMGERIGLLSPRAYPVHFRLNRRFNGTRVFLEQVDQNFLSARYLDPHYIFIGDITTEQIYGLAERKPLFHNPDAWEFDAPNIDRGTADSGFGEKKILHHLSSLLNRERNPYVFREKITEVLDVEAALRYIALLDIVGSGHIDDTHNHKWYLNPRTGVLSPVVWDTAAYMWGNNRKLSRPSNLLFKRLLQIPEFRARKNAIIWEALNGPLSTQLLQQYVREEAEMLEPDILANPFKQTAQHTKINFLSNEGWREGVESLKKTIAERNSSILAQLRASQVSMSVSTQKAAGILTVVPEGKAAIVAKQIKVPVTDAGPETVVEVKRVGLGGLEREVKKDRLVASTGVRNGFADISLNDTWYPWASGEKLLRAEEKAAVYTYELSLRGAGTLGEGVEITATSALTGEVISISPLAAAPKEAAQGWWSLHDSVEREQINLSGVVELKEDLKLDSLQDLIIKPGTTLKMGPNVSILVRGGVVQALGTEASPISIEPLVEGSPWGVIAVQGANTPSIRESVMKHVTVRGGSYAFRSYAFYQAPVSVHNAILKVEDSIFEESQVAAKDGELELTRVRFSSLFEEPIIAVNSRVQRRQVEVKQIPLRHSLSLGTADVVGTPSREEREFRYGITGRKGTDLSEVDGPELADTIHKALQGAVLDTGRWSAPKFTGTFYRVSSEVGDSVYRDIYIDTAEGTNLKHNISYRLRNRFKSLRAHRKHVKEPSQPEFWPYRAEFQGKTGRENPETGLTVVNEARLEFRRQSAPFSEDFPPPPPPWELKTILPFFLTGKYYGQVTTPGSNVASFLKEQLGSSHESVAFEPRVVLVTQRLRQHLEIKSPWGTGPNPDQSFIITLDRSNVYEPDPYLQAVENGNKGMEPDLPDPAGEIFEVEMEFERNVSEGVAVALKAARASNNADEIKRLESVKAAFLKDQDEIVAVIRTKLSELGLAFEPVDKSKFLQAVDRLTQGRKDSTLGTGMDTQTSKNGS